MERVRIRIVLKECEAEKPLEEIINELVQDTIKKTVSKYDNIAYDEAD